VKSVQVIDEIVVGFHYLRNCPTKGANMEGNVPEQRNAAGRSRILVTGASGFVGSALVDALLREADIDAIVATDIGFVRRWSDARVTCVEDRLDRAGAIEALVAEPFDCIYHLATVAGVGSANFDLGRRTNLDATVQLLDRVRALGWRSRFIYASSVGVYGAPLPAMVDDDTLPVPSGSYGTHKLVCEYLLSDYSRAGFVDGLALRFPGIIARPAGSTTMLSAFLNDIFYAAHAGAPFAVPLEAGDGSWVMSLRCLIANLLHARQLTSDELPARRFWNLPATLVGMGELVAELGQRYGEAATAGFVYAPNPAMRAMFAQVPLHAPGAERLGFIGDGDVATFVANVIAEVPALQAATPR
jgi:nucleoside-diphosphate-sugar epimerase